MNGFIFIQDREIHSFESHWIDAKSSICHRMGRTIASKKTLWPQEEEGMADGDRKAGEAAKNHDRFWSTM